MGATIPPEAAPLLALPPSRFTAERDALARHLAERHDPAAAAVRKVRRPLGLAWVLNRLARERPREVTALLEAGDALRARTREALAGRGGPDLRGADERLHAAARTLRVAAEDVVAGAGAASQPAALARLELLLRAVAAGDRDLRDAFCVGLLEREPDPAGLGLAGLGVNGGSAATPLPLPPRRGRAADTSLPLPPHRGGRGRGEGGRRAAEQTRAREAAAHRKAVATAERAAARARADAERAAARAASARRQADDAERAAGEARARSERAEAELVAARR